MALLCLDPGTEAHDAGDTEWELDDDLPTTLRCAQLVKAGLLPRSSLPYAGLVGVTAWGDDEDVVTIERSVRGIWHITCHGCVSVVVRRHIGRRHHVLDIPGATTALCHRDCVLFADEQRAVRFEMLRCPPAAPNTSTAAQAEAIKEQEELDSFVPEFQKFSQDSSVALSQPSVYSQQHTPASSPGMFTGEDVDGVGAAAAVAANNAAAEEWRCLACEAFNAGFQRWCSLCGSDASSSGEQAEWMPAAAINMEQEQEQEHKEEQEQQHQHTEQQRHYADVLFSPAPATAADLSLAFDPPSSPSLSPLQPAAAHKPSVPNTALGEQSPGRDVVPSVYPDDTGAFQYNP